MAGAVASKLYDTLNQGFAEIIASHEERLTTLDALLNTKSALAADNARRVELALHTLGLEASNQSYQCVIKTELRDLANDILLEALGAKADQDGGEEVPDPGRPHAEEIRQSLERAPSVPEPSGGATSANEGGGSGAGDFTGASSKLNLP